MSLYNNDYSLEIASSYENILSINEEDFYEISPFSIKLDNLVLEFGEEWRVYDKEWKDKVRFIIYTTKYMMMCEFTTVILLKVETREDLAFIMSVKIK